MAGSLKSTNIVFVHGLFGWGPGEFGGLPYWGDALAQFEPRFATHEAKCGPLSSFHDRACELFAQIAGGTVDYGAEHSAQAGHARHSRCYANGFIPNWSADNPVILVGHSAGAHTCLQLQALLARDFWGRKTSADWVEAVVSVAGVLNGSLLTYMFGCDKQTGRLNRLPSHLIAKALDFLALAAAVPTPMRKPFDLYLDQWTGTGLTLDEAMSRLDHGPFVRGEDNLGFDLTLQGCRQANAKFSTNPGTYYLSLVTDATHFAGPFGLPWFGSRWRPDAAINLILRQAAIYQAQEVDFDAPPIEGWGAGDLALAEWRRNDGAVSVVSQRHPFTARAEPVGGEGIFARGEALERGKWYFEYLDKALGERFDHFDPVVGARLKPLFPDLQEAQKEVYRRLNETLARLR